MRDVDQAGHGLEVDPKDIEIYYLKADVALVKGDKT